METIIFKLTPELKLLAKQKAQKKGINQISAYIRQLIVEDTKETKSFQEVQNNQKIQSPEITPILNLS